MDRRGDGDPVVNKIRPQAPEALRPERFVSGGQRYARIARPDLGLRGVDAEASLRPLLLEHGFSLGNHPGVQEHLGVVGVLEELRLRVELLQPLEHFRRRASR